MGFHVNLGEGICFVLSIRVDGFAVKWPSIADLHRMQLSKMTDTNPQHTLYQQSPSLHYLDCLLDVFWDISFLGLYSIRMLRFKA